jgi:membrane-associated protease RseP (regulator of RpoE activity)
MASPLPEEMKPIAGTDKGVLINSITDNSPAAKAGLLAGDVITALDGKEVTDPGQVVDITRQHKRGDQMKVTYFRMGKRNETTVTLGEVPQARGLRPMELPEELYKNLPQIREYLEKALPDIEEWARQHQPGLRPPIPGVPMPEWQPPQGRPQDPSYDMGKDMGRIMERLDRLEKRLSDIDQRLKKLEK